MLIPRTSTTSRLAIVNPAKVLMLYDTTTSSFWFHNGSAWTQLSAAGNGWNITGNAGTNPSSNFIGTTDNQPLLFRVNNAWAGEIHPTRECIFGVGAGQANTTGYYNTAIGADALNRNKSGKRKDCKRKRGLFPIPQHRKILQPATRHPIPIPLDTTILRRDKRSPCALFEYNNWSKKYCHYIFCACFHNTTPWK